MGRRVHLRNRMKLSEEDARRRPVAVLYISKKTARTAVFLRQGGQGKESKTITWLGKTDVSDLIDQFSKAFPIFI